MSWRTDIAVALVGGAKARGLNNLGTGLGRVLVREGERVGSPARDGLGLGVERLIVVGRERDCAVRVSMVVAAASM